jgi:hypothetical protein
MEKLKAYIVSDLLCENYSVTFAKTSGQAKSNVINSWDFQDCDYTELRTQRKKEWDKYADSKKIPVAELLKNCWWFECKGCGKQLMEDDIISGDAVIIEDYERNDFVQGNIMCKECAEREELYV